MGVCVELLRAASSPVQWDQASTWMSMSQDLYLKFYQEVCSIGVQFWCAVLVCKQQFMYSHQLPYRSNLEFLLEKYSLFLEPNYLFTFFSCVTQHQNFLTDARFSFSQQ